jgi:hypothetical protein
MTTKDYIAQNDRMRIHLGEAWQVAYWIRVLDVSEEELRALVREVGNEAHLVRARLFERREVDPHGNTAVH